MIGMKREVGLAREIAFELYPVETLDIFLRIGIEERVQFAIGDVIEIPAIRAYVLRRRRKLYSYLWIMRRNDRIPFDLAFRSKRLRSKRGRAKNEIRKTPKHQDLHRRDNNDPELLATCK